VAEVNGYIQVCRDLISPKHYKTMGAAVWLYLWLLDHYPSDGLKVFIAEPIPAYEACRVLDISRKTFSRWCRKLTPYLEMELPSLGIYVLQSQQIYYKVGVTSRSPEERIKGLQTGNPHRIESLYCSDLVLTPQQAYRTEKAIHERLARYRACGEWFRVVGFSGADIVRFVETFVVAAAAEGCDGT